jgi:hypothetical protein
MTAATGLAWRSETQRRRTPARYSAASSGDAAFGLKLTKEQKLKEVKASITAIKKGDEAAMKALYCDAADPQYFESRKLRLQQMLNLLRKAENLLIERQQNSPGDST